MAKGVLQHNRKDEPSGRSKCVIVVLAVIVVILVVICIILGCFIGLAITGAGSICMTERCLADAGRIKALLNTSVDPCKDFYAFACGGFQPRPNEPPSMFHKMNIEITNKVRQLLEERKEAEEGSAEKKMRDFYMSCVDPQTTEKEEMRELRELIRNIGGYGEGLSVDRIGPAYFQRNEFDLDKALQYVLTDLATPVFLTRSVVLYSPKPRQPLKALFQVDGNFDKTTCPPNAFGTYENLTNYARNMAVCFSSKGDTGNFEDDVVDIYKMICESSNFSMGADTTYKRKKRIAWDEILKNNKIIRESKIDWHSLFANPYKEWNLQPIELFTTGEWNMKKLIEIKETVEPRKIRNFLLYQFLTKNAGAMPQCIKDAGTTATWEWRGKRKRGEPLWQFCLSKLQIAFNSAALALMENTREQPVTTDKKLRQMLEEFREVSITRLNGLGPRWLDNRQKKVMENNIRNKVVMIGGPKLITDTKFLNKFYKYLTIKPSVPFLVNKIKAEKFQDQVQAVALRAHTIDFNLFILSPDATTINAFNAMGRGGLGIHWAIIQEPFYNPSSQKYLNYGGVGVVIGHEFGHDFDGFGATFQELEANRTAGDIPALVEAATCVVKHYNAIDYPGKEPTNDTDPVTPDTDVMTKDSARNAMYQSQGISDILGLKWAWEAYRKHVAEQGREDDLLPGLPYTRQQLFHIAMAQVWCAHNESTSYVRVNGANANDPYFSEAYDCPVGSQMNPKDQCDVW